MKAPVRVAVMELPVKSVIAYYSRIASGDMLGKDQPVILQLLEIEPA